MPTVRSYSPRALRLIYMGRLARIKGLFELLQAVRIVTELGIDARLTIAGDGEDAAALQHYARSLGIASRVTFCGPVFGPDKMNLLSGADLAVLASYQEGLPYAVLEAMAAGIPVLATRVGAIPDVVTDGIDGLLVSPGDIVAIAEAIAELSRDREKLSWMSRACRKRVLAAFSIERLARDLSIHYRALAGGLVVSAAGAAAMKLDPGASVRPRHSPIDATRPGGD